MCCQQGVRGEWREGSGFRWRKEVEMEIGSRWGER